MVLKKSGMGVHRLLIWLRIGSRGGICMVMNVCLHKMYEVSRPSEGHHFFKNYRNTYNYNYLYKIFTIT